MEKYLEIFILLSDMTIFVLFYALYATYKKYKNHNQVVKMRIENNQENINFYDKEKIKDSIKDKLFLTDFCFILICVGCIEFLDKKFGDAILIKSGLISTILFFVIGCKTAN